MEQINIEVAGGKVQIQPRQPPIRCQACGAADRYRAAICQLQIQFAYRQFAPLQGAGQGQCCYGDCLIGVDKLHRALVQTKGKIESTHLPANINSQIEVTIDGANQPLQLSSTGIHSNARKRCTNG